MLYGKQGLLYDRNKSLSGDKSVPGNLTVQRGLLTTLGKKPLGKKKLEKEKNTGYLVTTMSPFSTKFFF